MAEQLEHVNCILCGQERAEVFIRGKGPVHLVRCRSDKLIYMNPRPKLPDIRRFHTGFVRRENLELFTVYRREVLEREAEAVKRLKSGGRLLDVGYATGTFFEAFTDGSWHLFGVDLSPLGIEIARGRFHADVFCGTLSEAHFPDRFFDVVTVLDTLFYNPDPRTELIEIQRILKDDGLLAVEIPGLTYRLVRERGPLCWFLDGTWMRGFTNSSHLYYFSPHTIKALLELTGFQVMKVIPGQASRAKGGLLRFANDVHYALARLLFRASGGRWSIAAKELYLSVKADYHAAERGSIQAARMSDS